MSPKRYRICPHSNAVTRALRRIHPADELRIREGIESLSDNPRPPGCIQLLANIYRIRVGAYRVIYKVDDDQLSVEIGQVKHRNEATYRDFRRLF